MPALVASDGLPPVLVSHARGLIRTPPHMADRGLTARGMDIVGQGGAMAKKQEIRIVGFDCAEEEHRAALLNGKGELAKELVVTNRRDLVEEALAKLLLLIPDEAKLVVVLESRRSHGRIVGEVAEQLGCEVWVVNSIALNHYRAVEGQPHKTDQWDAYLAARMAYHQRLGCRVAAERTEEERVLSRLSRLQQQVTATRVQHVARLRAILLELAPEVLHKSWSGPRPNSKAMVYLLQRWPAFVGMEKARLATIEGILHKCRYGDRASGAARSLREMARRIKILGDERAVIALEVAHLLEQITACDRSLRELKEQIGERVKAHEIGVKLLEMPGIGVIVGGVIIGELLPVARLAGEGKCATYAGVTPTSRQTGKSRGSGHLARGVNKRLLHALYTSSVASIGHSAIDRTYYEKKVRGYAGHPKPTVAAFIALSRKRHEVIYKLMTTNERYNKEKLIASHLARLEKERQAAGRAA